MRFGLGVLRLPPKDFWSMTPRELHAAMNPHGEAPRALARIDLTRLMQAFPDEASS